MDNVEKIRVMLQHWIEHNKGHIEEFEKWQQTMNEEGQLSIAQHISEAIRTMLVVNDQLDQALEDAGGPPEGDGGHHHHHHH